MYRCASSAVWAQNLVRGAPRWPADGGCCRARRPQRDCPCSSVDDSTSLAHWHRPTADLWLDSMRCQPARDVPENGRNHEQRVTASRNPRLCWKATSTSVAALEN